jgi:hypothetical protein
LPQYEGLEVIQGVTGDKNFYNRFILDPGASTTWLEGRISSFTITTLIGQLQMVLEDPRAGQLAKASSGLFLMSIKDVIYSPQVGVNL